MTTSILSPKFQIVFPKEIRRRFGLKVGQKLQVIDNEECIEIRPILSPDQLIGYLKGSSPLEFERETDREF